MGCLVVWLAGITSAWAQYHLTEIGLRAGGGTNLALPMRDRTERPWQPSWAYNADVFCSHYFCGKPSGWHVELGVRGFQLNEQRELIGDTALRTIALPIPSANNRITMHYVQLGLYFKIRGQNFHKTKETCLMVGPKVNWRLSSRIRPQGGGAVPFINNSLRTVPRLVPGFQASVWFRRPIGNKGLSWFVIPGVDVYMLENASTETGIRFASLYPFVNLGVTFFDSRKGWKFF
jgi:hypothetical protein